MAFPSASGYNNLPNGVFSPTIFSKDTQLMFRKKAVAQDITNSEYMGEIADFGDTVKIIKEPSITVNDYQRGTQITPQDLEDQEFSLTVDRSKWFAFEINDIEKKQAHINWMDMAADRAAYELSNDYDRDILGYIAGYEYNRTTGVWTARTTSVGTKADTNADADELFASHKLNRSSFVGGGATTDSLAVGNGGTFDVTPLQILNRFNRILDLKNVDKEGRWVVIDPYFAELLMDENSKLINNDYNPGADQLENGKLIASKLRGFRVYMSNNLPQIGTGPGTADTNGSSANFGILIAGHDSAVATAQQISKTETFRSPTTFADVCRGMNLYARKILRPEALVNVMWNSNVG